MVSDEQIIKRVLKGHAEEYRELMLRYQSQAYRFAYRVLGMREEAEDATQEAFIRAYSRLGTCRDRRKFWPWLRRILLNLCLDRLRQTHPCDVLNETPDRITDSVEYGVLRQAELEEIRGAIAGLPNAYRIAVVLRYQEELSYKEIAEMLGEALSTIQVRIWRAKKMLAERLGVVRDEIR